MSATQETAEKEYHAKLVWEREQEKNKIIHVGDYEITRADREGFAAKISQLLWISRDDLKKTRTKGSDRQWLYQKDDIDARRKYFSAEAWEEYQAYLAGQRTILKNMGGAHMAAYGRLWSESAQYKLAPKDMISFTADGSSSYQSQDNWCGTGVPTRRFNLSITFLPVKPDAPDNFVIEKWQLQFCGANDLACLYKNAVKYERPDFEKIASIPAPAVGEKVVFEKDASDALSSRLREMLRFDKTSSVLPTKEGALIDRGQHHRKRYFSDTAWRQYMRFSYNAALNEFCDTSSGQIESFDVRKIDNANFQLRAKANYSNASFGRAFCSRGLIKIQSSFEKKGPAFSDFIFTSWQASVCDETGNECQDYEQTPSLSEQEASRSTQSYMFKSLLQWTKRMPVDRPVGEGGGMHSLDDRKRHFTDDAWVQYKKYIERINSMLVGRYLFLDYSPESQKFEQPNAEEIIFSVKGIYTDVGPTIDKKNQSGTMEAKISFQKTGETAADIVISNWSVVMGETK